MADRRATVLGLVGLLLVSVAACRTSSVSSQIDTPLPPDLPRCEDRYEDGKIIDYSADGDFAKACEENGGLVTPVPVDLRCSDGRRLVSNRYAWGYQGDQMTLFDSESDSARLPSEDEISACLEQPEETEEP